MAKIFRGRLDGMDGMKKFSSFKLFDFADQLEKQIESPKNTDDPRYLKRWAEKIRVLARQKERALEHKKRQ